MRLLSTSLITKSQPMDHDSNSIGLINTNA